MGQDGVAFYVRQALEPVYAFLRTVWPLLVFPLPAYAVVRYILSKLVGLIYVSREKSEGGTDCSLLFVTREELLKSYEDWKAGKYGKEDLSLDPGKHTDSTKSA